MIDINYMGTVHVTRAVVPSMKRNQHGRIVFISSQAGQIGLYGYTAYSGSKFALRGLAEALYMEVCEFLFFQYSFFYNVKMRGRKIHLMQI